MVLEETTDDILLEQYGVRGSHVEIIFSRDWTRSM